MRDIFSEGLLYLDLLEIYGSSYAVAELCGVAQSNVFRGASACSKLLNLGLSKDRSAGVYRLERNQDVQRDLRRLNQRLRAREKGQLRCVAPGFALPDPLPREQASLVRPLPCTWAEPLQSLEMLERGLLDLVVVPSQGIGSRLDWNQPLRRRDLFVPLEGFMVTRLSALPLVLLGDAEHPGWPESAETLDLQAAPVALTPALAGEDCANQLQLHEPEHVPSADHWFSALGDQPQQLLLSTLQECVHLAAEPAVRMLPLRSEPEMELLLLTPPSLVQEPLHQQLMKLLRSHCGDVLHYAQGDLALKLNSNSPS